MMIVLSPRSILAHSRALLNYHTDVQHYSEIFRIYGSLFLCFVLNNFSIICNVNSCTSVLVFLFFLRLKLSAQVHLKLKTLKFSEFYGLDPIFKKFLCIS